MIIVYIALGILLALVLNRLIPLMFVGSLFGGLSVFNELKSFWNGFKDLISSIFRAFCKINPEWAVLAMFVVIFCFIVYFR